MVGEARETEIHREGRRLRTISYGVYGGGGVSPSAAGLGQGESKRGYIARVSRPSPPTSRRSTLDAEQRSDGSIGGSRSTKDFPGKRQFRADYAGLAEGGRGWQAGKRKDQPFLSLIYICFVSQKI